MAVWDIQSLSHCEWDSHLVSWKISCHWSHSASSSTVKNLWFLRNSESANFLLALLRSVQNFILNVSDWQKWVSKSDSRIWRYCRKIRDDCSVLWVAVIHFSLTTSWVSLSSVRRVSIHVFRFSHWELCISLHCVCQVLQSALLRNW